MSRPPGIRPTHIGKTRVRDRRDDASDVMRSRYVRPCERARGFTRGGSGGTSEFSAAGAGPEVDAGVDREPVDRGELLGGEREVLEGTDVLLQLLDAAGADHE